MTATDRPAAGGVRAWLARTWGVRLLFEPRFQLVALSLLSVIVVGFRTFQFALLTQAPQFGYDVSAYWLAGQHLLHGEQDAVSLARRRTVGDCYHTLPSGDQGNSERRLNGSRLTGRQRLS